MSRAHLTGRSEAVSAEEFNRRTKNLSAKMGELAAPTRAEALGRIRAERSKPWGAKGAAPK
ncbi:hypothetical protein [Chelatococcus reniformis]|uniref:Uncharacterized protein n=1 Tax=Chelatococcus reniformis TaxID=1494448 RepID=A0A916U4V7_9HYPH|nr:hypothetical protein [Chelatococcus reniformis]GGC60124.1 hypothetical protein GCM10010994_18500 [Chelatococcus reniformis]